MGQVMMATFSNQNLKQDENTTRSHTLTHLTFSSPLFFNADLELERGWCNECYEKSQQGLGRITSIGTRYLVDQDRPGYGCK